MWLYPLLAVLVAGSMMGAAAVLVFGRDRLLEYVLGPPEIADIDFTTLEKTPRPNQYLVCPENFCGAAPDRASPVFELPVGRLIETWRAMLAAEPRVAVLSLPSDAEDGHQPTYVQRSAIFRFPDLVTVRFIALDDARSTLSIYSRSVYGRSDFGVNRRRIDRWLDRLSAIAPSTAAD